MSARRRLRTRIVIAFVIFGTALTALFALGALVLRSYLESRLIGRELELNLAQYATSFYRDPKGAAAPFERITGFVYSQNRFPDVPAQWRALPDGVHPVIDERVDGRVHEYLLAVRKDPGFWFFLRYDVTGQRRTQNLLLAGGMVALLAIAVLAWLIGEWLSTRVMRPVIDLARQVDDSSWSARTKPLALGFAEDEVGQLAQAFDAYADRLRAVVERDREFNNDVSHELRTPLAVISNATELMLSQSDLSERTRERLQRIARAADQSIRLTTALLHLSRAEREPVAPADVIAISRIVGQVVDSLRSGLQPGVGLGVQVAEDFEVLAPMAVIAVALTNLLGNAIKYTASGSIEVVVGSRRVEILDSGPGVANTELQKVFERHVRGRGAGGEGAGLGLAIVRRLCELYDWKVELASRAEGGLRATLDFGRSALSRRAAISEAQID